jgi:hypothetical protein
MLAQPRSRSQLQAAATDSWSDLPERIRQLLKSEGLDSPCAWRAAGRRRTRIYGIPTPLVSELDRLARGAT